MMGDFPGGPMAKAPRSKCWGPGFNPWSGNWIQHVATKDPHATAKTWCGQINIKIQKTSKMMGYTDLFNKYCLTPSTCQARS